MMVIDSHLDLSWNALSRKVSDRNLLALGQPQK